MKRVIHCFIFFVLSYPIFSQDYTWVKGTNTIDIVSVYGTQGVANTTNNPGSRHGCATWTDALGNRWLFGGEGLATTTTISWLNDLWKYNPVTNEWTWIRGLNGPNATAVYGIQGVSSPANDPGAREFARSWIDAAGNFWLFGGDGFDANANFGRLGDLWKYNPVTNEWTWMKGPNIVNIPGVYGTQNISSPSNFPGGRNWPATWTDNNGKLWLFGGLGYSSTTQGRLNDLWKYDPVTNEWTWMSGSSAPSVPGVYGTLSVPAATNYPGGRDSPAFWKSAQGNLVLFGGFGLGSNASPGFINDLWEYDINAGTWAWKSGSSSISQIASFGTQGVAAASNIPGGRLRAACWTDMMGNYWLFGGVGLATNQSSSMLNDLFMYNPLTNQWTWVKGSNQYAQNGTYGTLGVSAPANTPGAREYNTWWENTTSGFLWLFGGLGYDAGSLIPDNMNDLWKFRVPCNPDSAKATGAAAICSGNSTTLTAYNLFPSQVSWFSSPTSNVVLANGMSYNTPTLNAQGTPSIYTYYAGATICTISPRALVTITVLPLPVLNVTSPSSVCPGQTATMSVSGASSYTWMNGVQTSTVSLTTGTINSVWSVTGNGQSGCQAVTSVTLYAFPQPAVGAISSEHPSCVNQAVTLSGNGANTYTWNGTDVSQSIIVSPTITTTYTLQGTDLNGCTGAFTYTQFVVVCVGQKDNEIITNEQKIYPNPSSGSFWISSSAKGRLIIINPFGETVIEKNIEPCSQFIETELNSGVFVYQLIYQNLPAYKGKLVID